MIIECDAVSAYPPELTKLTYRDWLVITRQPVSLTAPAMMRGGMTVISPTEYGGPEIVNPSTSASESSHSGPSARVSQFPRENLVTVNAGDAIASVCASLIGFALLNSDAFHEWFQTHTEETISENDLVEDLTNVRETLKDMGYVWP